MEILWIFSYFCYGVKVMLRVSTTVDPSSDCCYKIFEATSHLHLTWRPPRKFSAPLPPFGLVGRERQISQGFYVCISFENNKGNQTAGTASDALLLSYQYKVWKTSFIFYMTGILSFTNLNDYSHIVKWNIEPNINIRKEKLLIEIMKKSKLI